MKYNNFITKIIISFSLLSTALSAMDLEPNYYYANTSINYLNWTGGTKERSYHKDFTFLEVEGGAGWDGGEFYMFIDLENPTKNYSDKPARNKRYTLKPIVDIKLAKSNFYFHVQDYMLYSKTFYVNNIVTGISYKYQNDSGFWIKPFIGSHYQKSTYYSGINGWMAGWVFSYPFKLNDTKFSISQWHEEEFNRKVRDYQLGDGTKIGNGQSSGRQGAIAFWWHPIKEITTGIQYRYAYHKLGVDGNQAGFIYSLKYNFK